MKLSKLYSNKPDIFNPIIFNNGLNIIMGEIRCLDNDDLDTHNLGKSILGKLIDFCLLAGSKNIFYNKDIFDDFIFYLEIKLNETNYITIKRAVAAATKISFQTCSEGKQDFTALETSHWEHIDIPFETAKKLLDGWLNWKVIEPFKYRQIIGYLLRSQDDYGDVFHLSKNIGKDKFWKPCLATVMGFDGALIERQYEKEDLLKTKQAEIATIKLASGDEGLDGSSIQGFLQSNSIEIEKIKEQLITFDFYAVDLDQTRELVDNLDVQIADYNERRYILVTKLKKIEEALTGTQVLFKSEEVKKLFEDVQIVFDGQIKKDFEHLIAFNKAITAERNTYLRSDKEELLVDIQKVDSYLIEINQERQKALAIIKDVNIFNKYNKLNAKLNDLNAQIKVLEYKLENVKTLQNKESELEVLSQEYDALASQVRNNVNALNNNKSSFFNRFRNHYSEIIHNVFNQFATISVNINNAKHIIFDEHLRNSNNRVTEANQGHSYKKLSCIAFDLALLRVRLNVDFPRFVYHDGAFETLDNRKKINLLKVFREYASYGIQVIVTMIDSDIPSTSDEFNITNDIILTLHDEGNDGLLFKMSSW